MIWITLSLLCFQIVVVSAQSQVITPYESCRNTFKAIINGSLTIGSINNDTIWESDFLYTGAFARLDSKYPRSQIITPTYLGCKTICGTHVHLNFPTTVLELVTTWVFPLAILLSLPYDSLHKGRFRGTLSATLNWIGSPQTALGATIHNFLQITKCRRGSKDHNNDPRWTDLYYVLSVFNQFDGPSPGPAQDHFISTLIYGLYRTVSNYNESSASEEVILTREILSELAYQLRMLRRRGVIPTMASLGTFIAAFIISIVLSFADAGQYATVELLGLGLLFGWLPVLVIFAIVDRNPVSAGRSSELMSRWLYNVDAIRTHFHSSNVSSNQDINWWKTNVQHNSNNKPSHSLNDKTSAFKVGDFIGQGRRMKYCGLVPAILHEATTPHFEHTTASYDSCAAAVIKRLHGRRPVEWFAVSVLSFALVWIQISMAFMFSYNTPTIGIGCWTGSYIVFGFLSSVSWTVQMCVKWPGRWMRVVCHVANLMAVCWLVCFTVLMLTGGFNTCLCKTIFGTRYMNFETAKFYLEYCNVQSYWIGAASIGGLVPLFAFFVALSGWLKCQQLWAANERGPPPSGRVLEFSTKRVDWSWLRYNVV